MVSIKFLVLATALLAAVQTDAAGRRKHKPGTKRHSQGDDPASFYYLVRCAEAASALHSVFCGSTGMAMLTMHAQ